MWPLPRGFIRREASLVLWMIASRLTLRIREVIASSSASKSLIGMIAATLQRKSSGPSSASTLSM